MSLDVYLHTGEDRIADCEHCGGTGKVNQGRECVYDSNITHNLNRMAEEAGIYQYLWRPEELGITKAKELIEPLRQGLARLEADQQHFEKFNAPNGWGLYIHFVPWVKKYLQACEDNPEADVSVSR